MRSPSRFWLAVLRVLVHQSEQQFVEGDLEETYYQIVHSHGEKRARQWYRSQVVRSIPGFLSRTSYWSLVMTRNYLLLALRNVRKSLGFITINVSGLAVGIACTVMIGLFTLAELSFDRHHEDADRIMRLIRSSRFTETETVSPITAAPIGPLFAANFPEIDDVFRVQKRRYELEVRVRDEVSMLSDVYDADARMLEILTVERAGVWQSNALEQAFSAMLSESVARTLFGSLDPTGQTIDIQGQTYAIDGVFRDFPATSHFRPSMLISFETLIQERPGVVNHMGNNFFHTYLLLAPEASREAVEAKFPAAIEAVAGPEVASRIGFRLQPMTDIHLRSHMDGELEVNGSVEALWILGAIGLFILILAVVNFINLATARSSRRAREVGVRKAVGAHRSQVVSQFLGETLVLSFLALIVALLLVVLGASTFEQLSGRALDLTLLLNPGILATLAGFTVVVGLISGFYPAVVLSRYRPSDVLKGAGTMSGSTGSMLFRRGLVVFQFSVSIVLIIGTLIVSRQLDFLQSRPLGFDKEQVLVTRLGTPEARRAGPTIMETFDRTSGVVGVSASSTLLGNGAGGVLMMPQGIERGEDGVSMGMMHVDHAFVDLLDVPLIAGRTFDEDRPTDQDEAFLINRQAARRMGWTPDEAVDKSMIWPSSLDGSTPNVMEGRIIGVLEDFHFASLHSTVEPLAVVLADGSPSFVLTRIAGTNITSTMIELEQAWTSALPGSVFDSFFLDDHFNSLYESEARSARLFRWFATLAMILAGLGLLGLASYTTARRVREIGIRKVMGASTGSILRLLVSEFAVLVAIAFVVASPIAWWAMSGWLANFPYHVTPDVWVFLAAGLMAGLLTVLCVGYHSIRAAWSDPIESIRYE